MKGLLLAVDIGNTIIECGLYDGERALAAWRLTSSADRTADECWQLVSFFCRESKIDPGQLTALAVASVVPMQTRNFLDMAKDRFDPNPLIISVETCPFIEVRYEDSRQVGADRLCNTVAGFHYFGGPLIVVDFGTAITHDVISEDGAYLGGIIVPGPATAASILHRRTAQLPQVTLDFPDSVIGNSTEHGIRAGLTWGVVDMIDGLIDRVSRELPSVPKVVMTGGFAEGYAIRSRHNPVLHPNLVLDGVHLIYSKIRGAT